MSDIPAPLLVEFPAPGSDAYLDAAALGKLQREIGENIVDGVGADEARKQLAAARAAIAADADGEGPNVA